jgi:hypothetical protein
MRRVFTLVLAAGWLAAGCATNSDFIYQPSEQATAQVSGRPAARYGVPPEKPMGDVRVTAFGVKDVHPPKPAPKEPVVTTRLVIANNSDPTPWTLDTRQQALLLPPSPQRITPVYANSDAGPGPIITIYPGQQRTVDLFFPLPKGMDKASKLPDFDLAWQVDTSSRLVAERTPFERQSLVPLYTTTVYDTPFAFAPGWAPYWWYDPLWPRVAYIRPYGGYHFYR